MSLLLLQGMVLAYDDITVYGPSASKTTYSQTQLPVCSNDHTQPGLRFVGFPNDKKVDETASNDYNYGADIIKNLLTNALKDGSNNKCITTSFVGVNDKNLDHTFGVQMVGYLYVQEPINLSLAYQIEDHRKHSWDNCWQGSGNTDPREYQWTTTGISLVLYDINTQGNPIALRGHKYTYDGYCAQSSGDVRWSYLTEHSNEYTLPNRKPDERTSPKYLQQSVNPGVYLILIDERVRADNSGLECKARINIHNGKFEITQGISVTDESDLTNTGNQLATSKYFITPYLLTETELEQKFGDSGSKVLCDAVGGDYSSAIYPLSKRCCGDSADDKDYIDKETGLVCVLNSDGLGGTWVPFLNNYYDTESEQTIAKGYCSEQDGVATGADALNYDDVRNDIGSYDFSARNGLDGCCGDDTGCVAKDCSDIDSSIAKDVAGCYQLSFGDTIFTGSPEEAVFRDCAQLNKDACKASDICEWNKTNSDAGYVSTNGEYFCGKDASSADDTSAISLSSDSLWKWWDAGAAGVPFKIHTTNGVDYISNGMNWFYCDATGDVPAKNGAIPIHEGQSFTSATSENKYSCVDALNALASENVFPEATAFNNCKGNSNSYCCELTGDGAVPGYDPHDGFLASTSECLDYCYISQDEFLGDYLDNAANKVALNKTYCDLYPSDFSCGNPLTSLFSKSNAFVEKSVCGFTLQGCLDESASLDAPCNSIRLQLDKNGDGEKETYVGQLCGDGSTPEYCSSNEYLLSSDTTSADNNHRVCCLEPDGVGDSVCQPITADATEQECRSAGGSYLQKEQLANYICSPTNVAVGSCCIGGTWIPRVDSLSANSLSFAQPNAFICYQQSHNNQIAECCNDFSICHNAQEGSLFKSANKYEHGFYGTGGVLHTIQNYDKVQNNSIVDIIKIDRGVKKDAPFNENFKRSNPRLDFRRLANWTSFDNLEFDVAYNLDELKAIVLTDTASQICIFENFSDYLVNGKGAMRWHHVVVPLNDSFSCASNFNWLDVMAINLTTMYTSDNLQIAVDNFFLSESPNKSTSLQNTQNYYCTGNFGKWIENLDGPNDTGVRCTTGDCFTEKGPYWYACEAQASFDWTGSRCCGDDTRKRGGEGEYYTDSDAACFSGSTVYSDMTVGESLNDATYDNLLYYVDADGNGAFYVCKGNASSYQEYNVSYGDTSDDQTTTKLVDTSPTHLKKDFDVLGTHLCDSSGRWVNVDSVSKARIIAAKMYNISASEINSNDPHYTIFCESLDAGTPLDLKSASGGLGLASVKDYIKDFCVLSYGPSANKPTNRVLIGLGLQKTNAKGFLRLLLAHAKTVEDLSTDERQDAFVNACDNVHAGEATTDTFFRVCDYGSGISGLRMAYNPELNILFMAYTKNSGTDFDSLFSSGASILSFAKSTIDSLTSWISGWFKKGTASGTSVEWSSSTLLPLFANNSIDFSRFYLLQQGEKTILGVAQTKPNTNNLNTALDDDEYYTIEYTDINSSVKPLATRYYTNHPYALNYMFGNESDLGKQTLVLVNPNDKTLRYNYEPPFDWRRLTTGLSLNPNIRYTVGTYRTIPNEGIVELGEDCDSSSNGINVYKFNNNSCAFWNNSYSSEENVTCTHNKINYSSCQLKQPTNAGSSGN